jgi:hypothetical protein
VKPEFSALLKAGRDDRGDLTDWVDFRGPAVMLIPVLEMALDALRASAAVGSLPEPSERDWPFGSCGARLVGSDVASGPCVKSSGHPPEAAGGIKHRDASAFTWWEKSRVA